MTKKLARYKTVVHAFNRHSGLGIPVTVYAENRSEAVERAVDIGWSGNRSDARVTIQSIEEVFSCKEEKEDETE